MRNIDAKNRKYKKVCDLATSKILNELCVTFANFEVKFNAPN